MDRTLHHLKAYKKYFILLIFSAAISWIVVSASPKYFFADSTEVKIVKCYPNPATSFINFEFPKNVDKNFTLQVYSFSGKQMSETTISSGKMVFSLNNFFRGIYVFQLRDKAGNIIDSGKFQVIK